MNSRTPRRRSAPRRHGVRAVGMAGACAVALALSSCIDIGVGQQEKGTLSFQTAEPKAIVPQRDAGSQIGMALCANLMEVNSETQELEPLAAKSVTSEDAVHWDIELRDGWTFHDGTPVTADSFADAWNATALGSNAWLGNYAFVNFKGYDALNPSEGKAKTTKLSGVQVVDKNHLAVTLQDPMADFPKVLSTNPTCPMPASAFKDPEGYANKPISNGPYEFVSWDHNKEVVLRKWDDFKGGRGFGGEAEKLVGKIYTAIDPAYTDMTAGNLDMIRNVPAPMVTRAKAQLGETALYEVKTSSKMQSLNIPDYLPQLKNPDLRRAISLSIDRDAIAQAILKGNAVGADSLVPSSLDSYRKGTCEYCRYDPDEAKRLLKKAGGIDGPLVIEVASTENQQLLQAIQQMIKDNLGIEVKLKQSLGTSLSERSNNGELDGPQFGLWGWSYQSPDQFLSQYQTGGDGNQATAYSNPEVDKVMKRAQAEQNPKQAAELYHQAEELILDDLPSIPLFVPTDMGLRSECADLNDVQGDLQFYRAGYAC
jgi:oligopeptide transport system substrate-binding protein